jgi:hypothetical protein
VVLHVGVTFQSLFQPREEAGTSGRHDVHSRR